MKSRNRDKRVYRSLFTIKSYVYYFLLIGFTITCCILLFLSHIKVDYGNIRESAVLTFANVLLLSLLFTILDGIYRKLTVERPVRRILEAAQRLTQGDFSVRIQPFHEYESSNELDVIIEDFNKMAAELSGIETLRTDFISNVSHELKTPLAIIQNYASMLKKPDLPEENRMEYAEILTEAAARLSSLITNILKLNKLENQQIYPEVKEYDLGNQLCDCILGFENVWEKKKLEIDTDLAENVKVENDAELLSLVWNNLLSNAVKFTEPGGKITVSLHEEENTVVVMISDTGCGMSPEIGRRIFEKFYQGDESHATQGNGLGLALVKRVMDIVGGEISVASEQGKGSTFTVRIEKNEDKTNKKLHR